MQSYSPSTIARIGDIKGGLRVETGSIAATVLLDHDPSAAVALFNIYGRLLVLQLYVEVLTALSANAATLQFVCTFTTPVIAENAMGGACASLSAAARGLRVVHVGGVVATLAIITDSAGLSDVSCITPHIVGGLDFVGTIGSLCGGATCTSGTLMACLHYIPYSDGAYAQAIL
jgi:hypothetical protein